MTSARATAARECPVCDARNSGLSLFCAECGSALNGSPPSDTTAFATIPESDSQLTQAFTPVSRDALSADHDRWRAPQDTAFSSPSAPAHGTAAHAWAPTPSGGAAEAGMTTVVFTSDQDRGIRGFILGVVSIALIAILLGLYLWAGVLSDATRDTIGGWFGIFAGSGG